MNIASIAANRHATKAFDPARKLPAAIVAQVETLLHLSPSSINTQPWHFVIAASDDAKVRIAKAAQGPYSANDAKIRNASHVVVFCTRTTIDDPYLEQLLAQEAQDGRLADDLSRTSQLQAKLFYTNIHRFERRDAQHWMEKQVYLSVGALLLGAAAMQIDACPIEGFDSAVLDEELDLHNQGLTSSVLVALGYRSEDDFNARLPKSRLSTELVITRL